MNEQPTEPITASHDDQPDDETTERVTEPVDDPVDEPGTDVRSLSGRHPVNVAHLVMGVAFVVLAAVWTLVATDAVEPDDVRWLLPVPWLAAGATGLAALALRGRRSRA